MRSPFVLDSDVIGDNSRKISELLRPYGFRLVAVLKHGFRSRHLIEILLGSGVDAFAFALPPPAGRLGRSMSLYPSASRLRTDWPSGTVFTELAHEPIARHLTTSARVPGRPLDIMVPVVTSDGREGLHPGEVLDFVASVERQFGASVRVRGVQACFGCVDDVAPDGAEIVDLHQLTQAVAAQTSSPMVLSLGGSAILPELAQIPRHPQISVEIRCGEAIVAGTVPGRGSMFGLRPAATLIGDVIQARRAGGKLELVVDRGEFAIAGQGTLTGIAGGRIVRNTSQHSVIECPADAVDPAIRQVEFVLSYADTVRCLDTGDRSWDPSLCAFEENSLH